MSPTSHFLNVDLPADDTSAADEFWRMSNLYPEQTGLPYYLWISVGQGVRHGPRVKVARTLSDLPQNMSSVSITEPITVHSGPSMSNKDINQLKEWIELNRETLLDYWNMQASTLATLQRIKRI